MAARLTVDYDGIEQLSTACPRMFMSTGVTITSGTLIGEHTSGEVPMPMNEDKDEDEGEGQMRLRVTTIARNFAEAGSPGIAASFDQDATAVLVAHIAVFKAEIDDSPDFLRGLRRSIAHGYGSRFFLSIKGGIKSHDQIALIIFIKHAKETLLEDGCRK
ncbi:hypothetical protein BGW80DRAFT_1559768, partial [Lactifluus volemus]